MRDSIYWANDHQQERRDEKRRGIVNYSPGRHHKNTIRNLFTIESGWNLDRMFVTCSSLFSMVGSMVWGIECEIFRSYGSSVFECFLSFCFLFVCIDAWLLWLVVSTICAVVWDSFISYLIIVEIFLWFGWHIVFLPLFWEIFPR